MTGLDEAQVQERVRRREVNDLPSSTSRTTREIVRANVLTRFTALLGGLLVLILIVGSPRDALFGGVLVVNIAVGILQELRAKRTLDRLAVLTAPRARVVRSGRVREVPPGSIVLDDVLELAPGDQVVVDGTVLEERGLEIDESLLSGEAEPVARGAGDEVLSGSFVVAGSGRYVATRVGRSSYAATLAREARRFTLAPSELRSGIDRLLRWVTWAIVPTGALLLAGQFGSGLALRPALHGSVAGIVAMVPEGLVLLTSLAFAAGAVRLARRHVLTQDLQAVETLARVDVLCIDKTGTLTEGRLVVEQVRPLIDGLPVGEPLGALAAADPRPNATLLAIRDRYPAPADGWRPGTAVPFSSARRWSAASLGDRGTWILGAPDVLLPAPQDPVRRWCDERAESGGRVVLLARSDLGPEDERLPASLTPAAIVVLGDRVRAEAAQTLRYFVGRGVSVKVISGDHTATVAAVARAVDTPGAHRPVDGTELPEHPGGLADVLEEHGVFGRVTPDRKRDIVRALRERGHVVAMTGDGVNDTLALKEADLGIAIASGSPACRAVAQLVLLDSTLDALPGVVDEGRRVLGNIERTANLYVTKTVYAMLLALGVGVLQLPFPFLPRHLTLVGTLTIGVPSFFLALAPSVQPFRPRFLRRVLRFAVPAGLMAAGATFAAYTLARDVEGISLSEERTAAVMVLCWTGFLVLALVAAPLTAGRRVLLWSLTGSFLAVLVVPELRAFFALRLPPPIVWLAALGLAALVWWGAQLALTIRPPDTDAGPSHP